MKRFHGSVAALALCASMVTNAGAQQAAGPGVQASPGSGLATADPGSANPATDPTSPGAAASPRARKVAVALGIFVAGVTAYQAIKALKKTPTGEQAPNPNPNASPALAGGAQ